MDTCTWPINYSACGASPGDPLADPPVPPSTGCEVLDEADDAMRTAFEAAATDYLWNATGRRFGVCETVVRPCRSDCDGARRWMSTFWGRGPYPWAGGARSWIPTLVDGAWLGVGCTCGSSCSCATEGAHALRLPGPVAEVTSVKINGVELAESAYRVMYGDVLVRTDGTPWPSCQNLLAEPTEMDTFEIVYDRGVGVPVGGQIAAGKLACEFALAACGSDDCALPERIQSMSRNGIQVDFFLSGEKWEQTGIWLIDSWVSSVTQPRSRPAVHSPDVRPRAATTMGLPWQR